MFRVFISYRRDDSAHVTGRIFDRLRAEFGEEILFRDVDMIAFGQDFREVIREAVVNCNVLLAVIGPSWLEVRNESGDRRLDSPQDFVRLELETALKQGIPVIPLMIAPAQMPKPVQLPESLQPLAFRNGLEIHRDPDFHRDMDRLIRILREILDAAAVTREPGEEVAFLLSGRLKMPFCWIPPGTLRLPWHEETDAPLCIPKGFWLGKFPVTQAEWRAVTGEAPSHFQVGRGGAEVVKGLDTSRFPVESVSWDDCQEFLKKLAALGGIEKTFGKPGHFVLPHSDAWQYAAHAGRSDKQYYYWGNEYTGKEANCDTSDPSQPWLEPALQRPTIVGSYAPLYPHPWGLCDMYGNVHEWCDDAPKKGDDRRLLYGGSWRSSPNIRTRAERTDRYLEFGCRISFQPC
jgi:formylglycine-generating enzyme required for sulfatase activity